MRNLLDEAPTRELHGGSRCAASLVDRADIAGRDVLDLGCGYGWFELFALDAGVGAITGVDVTDRDLQTARRHITDQRATFVAADATSLPFDDRAFDTVVSWEVLEHLPRGTEPRMFAEIRRVLRPGGAFYLSTPCSSLRARILDPAWWLIGHRHYGAGSLRRLAEDAGLAVGAVDVRGGKWQIASILNMYAAKWVFRRGPFFERKVNERVDGEMMRPGYANCFMVCRAPASPDD
jgi:SAM-dependent methyltransferase